MSSACEQAEKRGLEGIGLEKERRDVPAQVIDGYERQATRPRKGFRGRDSDEQCADEARPLRHGDAIEILERHARLRECLANHRRDQLEMATRCDLGNDAAELCV